MQKAFLVKGSSGVYATDSASWIVAVYLSRAKAEAHRDRALKGAVEFLRARFGEDVPPRHIEEATAFDPFFQSFAGHTDYVVEEVPLMETSSEANMVQWHVLRANGDTLTASELEASPLLQARARADFLATLPKARPAKA